MHAPAVAAERSRHISNAVRREVVAREGYQCSYVDADGNRCQERAFLEFYHRQAFARGGVSTAEGVTLRCHAHHAAQTELDFGAAYVRARMTAKRKKTTGRGKSEKRSRAAARSTEPAS